MAFEFFIGRRYLKAKKKEAFISLITLLSMTGVTLGVMALIVVIAVMSGAEADLQARILMIQPHVTLMRYGGDFADYREIQARLQKDTQVTSASPFTYSQAMLRSAAGTYGAVIKGIDPATARMDLQGFDLRTLRAAPAEGLATIALGREIAKNLKVAVGDTIAVMTPQVHEAAIGSVPRMQPFKIAGVIETGLFEYDQTFAFVHLAEAQRLTGMGDAVNGIEIRLQRVFDAQAFADRITAEFEFPFWARDWMRANRNIFLSLKQQKVVMFIILSLIVLVAAFSITSSLIMMVIEKTRDIAILKTMGATDASIRKIFVFKGMAIGLIGTSLGMALGALLSTLLENYPFIDLPGDVYYFTTLPVHLEAVDVFVISCAALLICLLASIYPAHRASRLDPVEGIRIG